MIHVLDRIHERHPELESDDVRSAWEGAIAYAVRSDSRPFEYIAIGFDATGRSIETVGRRTSDGDWIIRHAFTPPTRKALRVLGLGG